jgi:hypothetical protein
MEQFYSQWLINIAKDSAIYSDLVQKHGSILICDDMIITGYNHLNCSNHKSSISTHAEIDAITKFIARCRLKYYDDKYIRKKLRKSILITVRVKNDAVRSSTPCRDCIEIIKDYGIRQIIYSTNTINNDDQLIKKKIRELNNRPSSGYRWIERITNR